MLNILKAQYWPLCFAHLCCCFGFERSEASCYFKKSSILAAKKTLRMVFNITEMTAKISQRAMLNGQYRVFNLGD